MADVVALHELGAQDASRVGGKAASLGELMAAGLPVPSGFAVTMRAYQASRDAAGRGHDIAAMLAQVPGQSVHEAVRTCEQVREIVRSLPIPPSVETGIRDAYLALAELEGDPLLPVAVRSSAKGEDSAEASFAGEHDTYLWVRGADAVLEAVRCCWASLFTYRAVSYRAEMGLDHVSAAMGVVVQVMVRPTSAGVAFTLNPANGDRSVVAIDSAWGFGEGVVSGAVTPDSFLVDKVMNCVVSRVVSAKEREFRLDENDHVVYVDLVEPRASQASLEDAELLEIAALARRAELHAGCPQDVEWAVVTGSEGRSTVALLQTRPETVWTRFAADSVAADVHEDPMSSIVSTLMSPLHQHQED